MKQAALVLLGLIALVAIIAFGIWLDILLHAWKTDLVKKWEW